MKHFTNVLGHAFVATLIVLFAGAFLGVHFVGGIILGVITAAGISAVALTAGVFGLVGTRIALRLAQVGRLIQMGWFWLLNSLAFLILGHFFPHAISVTSAFTAGLSVLVLFTVLSVLTGNLKGFKGRAWLPVRMKAPEQK